MGDRGTTHGTVMLDYSVECIRCGSYGVVISPIDGRRGKMCPECLMIALEDLFAMSEAEEILTTGDDSASPLAPNKRTR